MEDLLGQLQSHQDQLQRVQQVAEDHLTKYQDLVHQREIAEARESAAIHQARNIVNQRRKAA